MAKTIKIHDCNKTAAPEQCIELNKLIDEGIYTIDTIPPRSGLYHTNLPPSRVRFKYARNSKTYKKRDAYIVLGSDRPDSVASGYGALGALNAATIDLVVGRMASANCATGGEPTGAQFKTGSANTVYVDNNFALDAARIYISQLTDIDKNFGLAAGNNGAIRQDGCSAIGLKADAIRIIGREGIKIVTGKAGGTRGTPGGECNSRAGLTRQPAPSIELIAGNSAGTKSIAGGKFSADETINLLQPIPLGENVRDALLELSDIVGHLWSAVFNFALIQTGQNASFGVSPFPWHAAAVSAATPAHLQTVLNSLYHTRANKEFWELNYLEGTGCKYICSRSVKTT